MRRPYHNLRALLGPVLEPLYAWEIRRRSEAFDRGLGVRRLGVPVISVGNLSTGGTGKTPMVAWLVRRLLERDARCAIAMRGYKAPPGGVSDEEAEYRREFPCTPVIVGADRFAACSALLASPAGAGVRGIVLDDGFQHRQLARDLDIVLVDATRLPWNDRLLPAGDLREPVSALARAGAVVLTRSGTLDEPSRVRALDRLRELAPGAIVASCGHTWSALRVVERGTVRDEPVSWLGGQRVLLACAIGNPGALLDELRARAEVVDSVLLRDHDPFEAATLERIIARAREHRAGGIVVTEKDWSKLQHVPANRWPCPLVRPVLRLEMDEAGAALIERCLGVLGPARA